MATEKEKAGFVRETIETEGWKILEQDIRERIEQLRDELETPVIENENDNYLKGQLAGLRFLLRLPETYRKTLEEGEG
jgi:hypothetical protein